MLTMKAYLSLIVHERALFWPQLPGSFWLRCDHSQPAQVQEWGGVVSSAKTCHWQPMAVNLSRPR